jgi:hypothetical protein
MKKYFLPLFVFLFFINSFNIKAQSIKLGLRGGINIASLSFDPDISTALPGMSNSNRTAFLAGGIVQLDLAGPISLKIEPTYIQKGAIIEGNNIPFDISGQQIQIENLKISYKLGYLEIPILLRASIPLPQVKPYAEVGPAIGFNLSSSFTMDLTYGGQSISEDIDNKDNTSSTEFGLIFGAGIEYSVNPLVSFIVDGRYSLGLSDLSKGQTTADQQNGQNAKIKSSGIQITFGIMFGL